MGELGVKEPNVVPDLLTLIGHAIEQLRRCIILFEASETDGGVDSLSTVIEEIDEYLETSEADPLLRLAALPPERVRTGLLSVQSELASVVGEFKQH